MSQGINIHFDEPLLPEFSVKLQYFPDIADLRRKTAGTFPQFSQKVAELFPQSSRKRATAAGPDLPSFAGYSPVIPDLIGDLPPFFSSSPTFPPVIPDLPLVIPDLIGDLLPPGRTWHRSLAIRGSAAASDLPPEL